MKTFLKAASLAVLLCGSGTSFAAESSIDGQWDGVLSRNGVDIPFRFDVTGSGADLKGVFYDGFKPYDGTTSASFQDGKLTLNIAHYLTTISATLDKGALNGTVVAQGRDAGTQYEFHATRHTQAQVAANAPAIAGSWIIPLDKPSSKGESAFRFVVQQHGAEVAAAILRVDGDTGAYSGAYQDGKWVLSHFDGGRPGVLIVTPQSDGSLQIQEQSGHPTAASTAWRADVAQAKGLPQPDDFSAHTTARDPDAPFAFTFNDVNGRPVSNDDARFKNKVVLAVVTGTWCPNCHDEAKYLVQLDKKYRSKGLAIVALDFEEPGQQATLERQKAFVKKYGVKYTYLIAGAPSELGQKLPQLNHLDTWPATIFIGRDGKVKAVHAGFSSPATGEFNTQLKAEFTVRIEQLLAEKPTHQASVAQPAPRG
jgi:thiol-disulfide isomerase/thioredoxin